MNYRQPLGVAALVAGLAVVVVNYVQGDTFVATIVLVLLCAVIGPLCWSTRSGRRGAHLTHTAAQAAATDGDVIVYWRPGCLHCARLKLGLGGARREVLWVNILQDSEAAQFVAMRRDGAETVPTAVTGTGETIDATPAAIESHLRSRT